MRIIKESDQTYNRREIADYIIDTVVDDERFFNIMAAYDSDVSTESSTQDVKKSFLELADDIIPELDGDYEFEDQVWDMLQEDEYLDRVKDIDEYFEFFGDELRKEQEDEADEREREYRSAQGFHGVG